MYRPYSYSRLNTYKTCNRKFKYHYIDKAPTSKTDVSALLKGGAVHSILEHYPEPSTHKLAPKHQHIADKFLRTNLAQKYIFRESTREFSFGLTADLQPCGYSDKIAMFRGSVDYTCIVDGILHLIDWKTGKLKEERFQDYNQLMFYGIYFFQKYSKIDTIKISYVYIEHENAENSLILERKYLMNYTNELLELIEKVESDSSFEKFPSKLCDWCEYQSHCTSDI